MALSRGRGTRTGRRATSSGGSADQRVAASAAGTLDQSQTWPPNVFGDVTDSRPWAQTFTAGTTGDLDQVDVNLSRSSCDPGPLTVEIRTITPERDQTSTVLATATVPSSNVTSVVPDYDRVSVPFTPRAPSVAGTQYVVEEMTPPPADKQCADGTDNDQTARPTTLAIRAAPRHATTQSPHPVTPAVPESGSVRGPGFQRPSK